MTDRDQGIRGPEPLMGFRHDAFREGEYGRPHTTLHMYIKGVPNPRQSGSLAVWQVCNNTYQLSHPELACRIAAVIQISCD